MEELGRIKMDPTILDSFVFYFMLSIYLTSRGVPESVASKSLRGYIDEGRKNGLLKHPEVLGTYLQIAYTKIPSGFLALHEIPSNLGDGIRTIDVNYSWVKKL